MTSGQEILQAAYRIPPAPIEPIEALCCTHGGCPSLEHAVDALRSKLLDADADKEAGLGVSAHCAEICLVSRSWLHDK